MNAWPQQVKENWRYVVNQQQNGIRVWGLRRPEVIALLPQESLLANRIRTFYQALQTYYTLENSLENAIQVIEAGVAFFEAAKIWQAQANA